MAKDNLSIKEVEELGYYDFMGYMEVPFFNIGGVASIDRLAELSHIDHLSRVLMVGCGTGGNSCYLANTYGCRVTGIDIAEQMILKARVRAEKLGLTDRVTFRVGDAYNLDFPDDFFDAVLTVFVSQFLDVHLAFPGFHRVIKPGGYLGVNEMYKADRIQPEVLPKVEEGEQIFQEITELPFTLRSPTEWRDSFKKTGYTDLTIEEYLDFMQQGSNANIVKEFGGWGKIIKTIIKMLILAVRSGKIRQRMGKISRGKRILLRDKIASRYIGYILCVGKKP